MVTLANYKLHAELTIPAAIKAAMMFISSCFFISFSSYYDGNISSKKSGFKIERQGILERQTLCEGIFIIRIY
jgi:hypothetical protein